MGWRFLLLATLLVLSGCQNEKDSVSSPLDLLPENTSLVIKIGQLNNLKQALSTNDFLTSWASSEIYESITSYHRVLDYLQTDHEGIIGLVQIYEGEYEFILVTKDIPDLFNLEGVQNKTLESLNFKGSVIDIYSLDEEVYFSSILNGYLAISSSRTVLEKAISDNGSTKVNTSLQTLYEISSNDKTLSFFVKCDESDPIFSSVSKQEAPLKLSHFSEWISLDVDVGTDYLFMNGISLAQKPGETSIELFRNVKPVVSNVPWIAPANSEAILSYSCGDYQMFSSNREKYLGISKVADSTFNAVEEVGHIYLTEGKAILLGTTIGEKISAYLNILEESSTEYQGNPIFKLNQNDFLNQSFNPLIKDFDANFYTVVENTFAFATDSAPLRAIIRNHNSGSTFDKSPLFEAIRPQLAKESCVLFASNAKGMEKIMEEDLSEGFLSDFKQTNMSKYAFGAQMVSDNGFYHLNSIVQKLGTGEKNKKVSVRFKVQLDAEPVTDPQFVINHRTKKKELVVQDKNNTLYLISEEGKVLWKKDLKGRIQGRVAQVDIYKNGRLQLAFTTDKELIVLDRNGKVVDPFKKSYAGGNLNPLAVFDYDGTRNYRFVVTQGAKVFMYDSKGNTVTGFKYTQADSPVLRAPKHFRIGSKDYILFMLENKDLKIMNRVGDDRITVKDKIDFSENEVFVYRNKFTLTDKNGTFITINDKGSVNKTKLNLAEDHGLYSTSKTLVVMDDNTLSIKGKKTSLDLGVYSRPKIFYLYDKIYVAVTDIQSQKVFLFDSNSNLLNGFPVFGNSRIDLNDLDNDRRLELAAIGEGNFITVYTME